MPAENPSARLTWFAEGLRKIHAKVLAGLENCPNPLVKRRLA